MFTDPTSVQEDTRGRTKSLSFCMAGGAIFCPITERHISHLPPLCPPAIQIAGILRTEPGGGLLRSLAGPPGHQGCWKVYL